MFLRSLSQSADPAPVLSPMHPSMEYLLARKIQRERERLSVHPESARWTRAHEETGTEVHCVLMEIKLWSIKHYSNRRGMDSKAGTIGSRQEVAKCLRTKRTEFQLAATRLFQK